jgi:hypothetical protein
MVFNAIFNNISAISWRSVLLMEENGVREKTVYKIGIIKGHLSSVLITAVYICTGEDFISLQLVSYPFVLFCMTIKYV